jgi:hypothetical protein
MSVHTDMDATVVQRAREMTRERRAALLHTSPLPVDTAHVALRCEACGVLGVDAVGFGGGVPRPDGVEGFCCDIADVARTLEALFDDARCDTFLSRSVCSCGALGTRQTVLLVAYFHAMTGSGAELMLEAFHPALTHNTIAWRVARVPLYGLAEWIADAPDDLAVARSFGAPFSLAQVWREVLSGTAGPVLSVAPGQWIFAAPPDHPDLRLRLAELLDGSPDRRLLGLDGRSLSAPAWHWMRERLQSPEYAGHTAGMVIDLPTLRHAVVLRLRGAGLSVSTHPGGWTLLAHNRATPWPVELETVAHEALRGCLSLHAS